MKICIMYIKRGGSYPHTAGGLNTLTFNKVNASFISKTINELDMTDEKYHYVISTVIYRNDDSKEVDRINEEKIRHKLIKKLWKELKGFSMNKSLNYKNGFIFINSSIKNI